MSSSLDQAAWLDCSSLKPTELDICLFQSLNFEQDTLLFSQHNHLIALIKNDFSSENLIPPDKIYYTYRDFVYEKNIRNPH